MKLVVGLGNPGKHYAGSRHNLGAEVVAAAAQELGIKLTHTSLGALWGRGRKARAHVILALPQTFMNGSGQSVASLAHYFKIRVENILLVSDDLHLPLGRLRLRGGGSAGGHKGLQSVIEYLGTEAFPRLRVGIGPLPPESEQVDYVLAKFQSEQKSVLSPVRARAVAGIVTWLDSGLEPALLRLNA